MSEADLGQGYPVSSLDVVVVAGGKDGYVGRNGRPANGSSEGPPGA